jgi:hypothetical protein
MNSSYLFITCSKRKGQLKLMEKVSPVEIEIKPVDLNLTLYPSFALSIFNQLNGTYVKAAGRKRGCKMREPHRELKAQININEKVCPARLVVAPIASIIQ